MVGLFAAAVIAVNNYRDLDSDRKIGKNTLAVRIGRGGSQAEYALLLFTPYLLLPLLAYLSHSGWGARAAVVVAASGIVIVAAFPA